MRPIPMQDKLPFDVSKHLSIAQKSEEVYMEHVTCLGHHNVVIVSVADTKDIGCYTIARTRICEVFHSLYGTKVAQCIS